MKASSKTILSAAGVLTLTLGAAFGHRAMKGAPATENNPIHGTLFAVVGRTDEAEHYFEVRLRVYDGTDPVVAQKHFQTMMHKPVRVTVTPTEE